MAAPPGAPRAREPGSDTTSKEKAPYVPRNFANSLSEFAIAA